MFRDAIKEVRLHPTRVIATLVAIAISVGFMAAVSIFVSGQSAALGKQAALSTSRADLVVELHDPKPEVTHQQLLDALRRTPGVTAAETTQSGALPLASDAGSQYVTTYALPGEQFRWAKLVDGAWPTGQKQVALARSTADKLHVGVGSTVNSGDAKLTVSGLTDEPTSLFFQSAFVSPDLAQQGDTKGMPATVLVKADDTGDAEIQAIRKNLSQFSTEPDGRPDETAPLNLDVATAAAMQQKAVDDMVGEIQPMKYVLWVFSAIAALVGMIIIANTFTILLTQRRRQVGLLRAVGASGSQVRGRFLAEAVVLGLLGSLLGLVLGTGVAALGSWFTGTLGWGLVFPWSDLAVEVLVGVVLTVIAAVAPAVQATRVKPLEALQPVPTSEQAKRASRVRAVICGLLALVGLALAITSLTMHVDEHTPSLTGPMARAVLGSLLFAMGVLFGAPLFVPLVLRLFGAVFGRLGATWRMAALNSVRNPRRASATATALMLACGLIVTLQVGTATASKTAVNEIKKHYPVDISVSKMPGFGGSTPTDVPEDTSLPPAVLTQLAALPNVASRATFSGGAVTATDNVPFYVNRVVALPAEARAVTDQAPASLADDEVLVPRGVDKGTTVTLKGTGGTVTLKAVPSATVDSNSGVVVTSPAALAKLVKQPSTQMVWLKLANPDDIAPVMTQLQKIAQTNPGVYPSGSVAESFMVRKVLNTLLNIITALLGAAVLIALVGVSNTLGLSVVERTRESALLRALGMQKRSLRMMLLIEALMLALAGVLVGVLLGGFFGWLGVKAFLKQVALTSPVEFGVNWPMTLGLIAVTVLAAALASLLPGRRAANAAPTQALAEE